MTADWLHDDLPARFGPLLTDYPGDPQLDGALLDELTLHRERRLRIVWAPFDRLNADARLVITGITPGKVQAQNALRGFRNALLKGRSTGEALAAAKATGSFSGPMRANLVAMLDHVGANTALGVGSTAAMFQPGAGAVHFTSALRYPVFRDGGNYNGTPNMLRTPILRDMADTLLAAEAAALPGALWLPLGPKAEAALDHLASSNRLAVDRILHGLPHPSGANAERIAYFLGSKPRAALSSKTKPDAIDAARERLRRQLRAMR